MPPSLRRSGIGGLAAITLVATSVVFAGSAAAVVPGPPTDVAARAGDQLAEQRHHLVLEPMPLGASGSPAIGR